MLLATGGSALFGGCASRLCNFELADVGTDVCFSVGTSRVSKKFDMVVGNLKMSSLAGSEPADAEQSCQLVDTCDVKLVNVTSCENCSVFLIGVSESSRHPICSALSTDGSTVSRFAKIVEFRSHFRVVFLSVVDL